MIRTIITGFFAIIMVILTSLSIYYLCKVAKEIMMDYEQHSIKSNRGF